MTGSNIVTLTTYFIDQAGVEGYYYNVYSKEDYYRKKAIYMGAISTTGEFISCTCVGGSILNKCYHSKIAAKYLEVKLV